MKCLNDIRTVGSRDINREAQNSRETWKLIVAPQKLFLFCNTAAFELIPPKPLCEKFLLASSTI